MTKQELNRAVTKLTKTLNTLSDNYNRVMNNPKQSAKEREDFDRAYWSYLKHDAYKEFVRLHDADSSMKSFTAKSLLNMLILNRRYRFISLHMFASRADTY